MVTRHLWTSPQPICRRSDTSTLLAILKEKPSIKNMTLAPLVSPTARFNSPVLWFCFFDRFIPSGTWVPWNPLGGEANTCPSLYKYNVFRTSYHNNFILLFFFYFFFTFLLLFFGRCSSFPGLAQPAFGISQFSTASYPNNSLVFDFWFFVASYSSCMDLLLLGLVHLLKLYKQMLWPQRHYRRI